MPHGRPAKRRRITPPLDDDIPAVTVKAADLFARAADWSLEEEYEQRARGKKVKESSRLPIKTAEGRVQCVEETAVESDDDEDSFLGSGSDGDGDGDRNPDTPPTEPEPAPQVPVKQQILAAKEELARLAGSLNEDPEEHAAAFKKLSQVAGPQSAVAVQKLALAAQVAVYTDAIPGYRIRSYKDDELGNKVSKEVRRTRQYEHALVTGYHSYVKRLCSLAKGTRHGGGANRASAGASDGDAVALRSVAIHCACTLLLAVPHFNFRTDLLNVVVHELAARDRTGDFERCIETLEKLFADDEDGAASLEAVSLLTKMLKAKDYRVHEDVLNTFFHLRLLTELSPATSSSSTSMSGEADKRHGRKVKREKLEHRSKKERKLARERKAVEKDMREADASVNVEERERMQSETLKMVFVAYFRILKARSPELTGAVLEGLARYAHLINQDLFGDILEALKDIIHQAEATSTETPGSSQNPDHDTAAGPSWRNHTRESLLSSQTAFTLLSGQDVSKAASALHLDLSFFTSHTYRSLYPLSVDADIELGPQTLRLPDPHAKSDRWVGNKVNVSTPMLLLTRVLTSILLTPSQPPPTVTAAAFYKRLLTASLQLPEKSALALLSLLGKVADKHGRKIEALWHSDERKGDGVFRGESETVDGTNVFATGGGVWEAELLRKHYCPKVRDQAAAIDKTITTLHR